MPESLNQIQFVEYKPQQQKGAEDLLVELEDYLISIDAVQLDL